MLFIIKSNDLSRHKQILRFIKKGDITVLIQDGVLVCHNPKNNLIGAIKEKGASISVIDQDLKLRGVDNKAGVKLISYADLITLIEQNTVFS